MVSYGHQGDEAVIYMYVTYFKIVCAMGVESRDKGSALFHISFYLLTNQKGDLDNLVGVSYIPNNRFPARFSYIPNNRFPARFTVILLCK